MYTDRAARQGYGADRSNLAYDYNALERRRVQERPTPHPQVRTIRRPKVNLRPAEQVSVSAVLGFLVAVFCGIIRWSIVVHLDCVNRLSCTCITIVVIIPVASGHIRQPPSANHVDSVFYGSLVYLDSHVCDFLTLNSGKVCKIPYKRQDASVLQLDSVGKYYFRLL